MAVCDDESKVKIIRFVHLSFHLKLCSDVNTEHNRVVGR